MSTPRKPLMAGNWKMYKTVVETHTFLQELSTQLRTLPQSDLPDIVVCPPFTSLNVAYHALQEQPTPIALGAQNMEAQGEGAFTGEISAKMLADFAVQFVILGHSERRQYYNETDARVQAKTQAALASNLTPIVCVGESLAQREAGETDTVVSQQVSAALDGLSAADKARVVIAYEPIWAIGTGKVCDANEANRVIGLIRKVTGVDSIRILYGGSMKPDNVQSLMAQPEIDGGLVGGASLEASSFIQLIQAAMPARV